MAFFGALQSFFRKQVPHALPGEGERPAYRDTLTVIHDLSRLVRNDPEAVDIYLALGNLFRAQGDIERAVMIREGLITRRNLDPHFKARAYFELGQDYQRAGVVDRALSAYREAARLGYAENAVTAQLADLFAYAGDFALAAEEYGKLKHSLAQAHYLVRYGMELVENGQVSRGEKLFKKALRIYPGSIEAWNAGIRLALRAASARKAANLLEKALERVDPKLRFLLIDSLLEALPAGTEPSSQKVGQTTAGTVSGAPAASAEGREPSAPFVRDVCAAVIPLLEKQPPNILLQYYGALLLQRAGNTDEVESWLAKALVVQPDFWAARLQSLALSVQKNDLPPVVGMQVAFLADELKYIRRFTCSVCGFREHQVFYRCRRCGSWHSLAFRLSLQR